MAILIKENDVIIGLGYDIVIQEDNEIIHCLCPYNECKSYKEIINYYYEKHHKENRIPLYIQHHGYTAIHVLAC